MHKPGSVTLPPLTAGPHQRRLDLVTIVANLELKRRMKLLAGNGLQESTRISCPRGPFHRFTSSGSVCAR